MPAAPVFVTLRDAHGALRGCIGTLQASESTVFEETARNAVAAASRDPRFPAVEEHELAGLQFEVSVVLPSEPVASLAELDPAVYGVLVRDERGRRGVLLPAIPGIDSSEKQVAIARSKAAIPEREAVRIERFRVLKFR